MNQPNFLPSPYYISNDPVLPIDNILKPRRRYLGAEPHKIGLETTTFVMVHQNLKKAKGRQAMYAHKNTQSVHRISSK